MQTELLSISKIFTENLFRIPDYQRGYSWAEKQLKDFWNDIDQLEEGKNHYTGVLTLEQVPSTMFQLWNDDLWIIEAKRYTPYYIVDGQQRLTTTIILIQAILERISDAQILNYTSKEDIRKKFIFESKDGGISRSYLFGYEKDNPSYEFLKTGIFMERSDAHSTAEETIYTHNLSYAKAYFSELIQEFDHASIERLYARITQNLLFNIYTITDDIDVFVAFETMNNRGKPLSHLELLKNRLIFLSTKFPVDQWERRKLRTVINECWKAAYHYLGKNEKRPLNDDAFLEAHFFVHFGPELAKGSDDETKKRSLYKYYQKDYYKEYLLEELFTSRRLSEPDTEDAPSLSVDSLYDYAQNLKSSVKLYYSLFNPEATTFTPEEKVNLERLRRLGTSDLTVLLVAVYLKEVNGQVRARVLSLLERIRFLTTISVYILDIERLDYRTLGIEVSAGRPVADLIETLTDYLERAINKVNFVSVFANWTKGFYYWKGVKYFLFEYEQDLLSKTKTKRAKLDWETFANEKFEDDYETVEHIYPQRVVDDCWRTPFAQYSVKERNVLKHSIGNLVPLSRPKNSSLQNKCFVEKKGSQKNRVGYTYGCYSEIEVSQETEWTAKQIAERGIRLLEFMERRWKYPLGTKADKLRALRLQFVMSRNSAR